MPGLALHQGQDVRPIFDRLFREYGLPRAIRTDNGVPFATTGIHGLSQLNVWWLRLGYVPGCSVPPRIIALSSADDEVPSESDQRT